MVHVRFEWAFLAQKVGRDGRGVVMNADSHANALRSAFYFRGIRSVGIGSNVLVLRLRIGSVVFMTIVKPGQRARLLF